MQLILLLTAGVTGSLRHEPDVFGVGALVVAPGTSL